MNMRIFISVAALFSAVAAFSQTTEEYILSHPVCARAQFTGYPVPTEALSPSPDGYKPVYLSHYGRHGSRYTSNMSPHKTALSMLGAADEKGMLTPLGKSVFIRVKSMAADAEGRDAGLTVVGEQEHRGIAERMYLNYPEIFAGSARVECRSSEVPRSILSMAANNERLRELNPAISLSRSAYLGYGRILRNKTYRDEQVDEINRLKREYFKGLEPDRMIASIFLPEECRLMDMKSREKFMKAMYYLWQNTDCTAHTGVSFDEVFTPEELFVLWKAYNSGNYIKCGNSKEHGEGTLNDARPLVRDFVERADAALSGNGVSADLRFGHDTMLAPFLALVNVNGIGATAPRSEEAYKVWADFKVMPMAANIQIVFYKDSRSHTLVKILHNERECRLPDVKTDRFPYYEWADVREYLLSLAD